jgi:hypothetical protein
MKGHFVTGYFDSRTPCTALWPGEVSPDIILPNFCIQRLCFRTLSVYPKCDPVIYVQ